jgi:hypothetical protein
MVMNDEDGDVKGRRARDRSRGFSVSERDVDANRARAGNEYVGGRLVDAKFSRKEDWSARCTDTRGMSIHPVQLHVEPGPKRRVHVLIRLVLLAALGTLGCSSAYWIAFLAIPAVAALLVSRDGGERYVVEDASGTVGVLRWLAGAYAYLWLLTDAPPSAGTGGAVELTVTPGGRPTVGTALARLVTSLPALLLLALLSMVATILWLVGAVFILAAERLPAAIESFFVMKLRYQFRLVAYHLSLVETYPVLTDESMSHEPHPA